ncbi:MAG: RNA polymerase sigma factor [Planctomycetota bacterium]
MKANIATLAEASAAQGSVVRYTAPRTASTSSLEQEQRLTAGLRRGDENSFNELVRQHDSALTGIAMSYVGTREVAESVVEDTWFAVVEGIRQYTGQTSFRAWICRILLRTAKDRAVRGLLHQQARTTSRLNGRSLQSWVTGVSDNHPVSARIMQDIQRVVRELPNTLKDALLLRDIGKLPRSEICALLEISENQLSIRLHQAREQVRSSLERFGRSPCA